MTVGRSIVHLLAALRKHKATLITVDSDLREACDGMALVTAGSGLGLLSWWVGFLVGVGSSFAVGGGSVSVGVGSVVAGGRSSVFGVVVLSVVSLVFGAVVVGGVPFRRTFEIHVYLRRPRRGDQLRVGVG